jgi:serine/threonine protein kinase/Flp pilus assembly protein TadD
MVNHHHGRSIGIRMNEWLTDDPLFDRVIDATSFRVLHIPAEVGSSTLHTNDRQPARHRYELIETIGQGGIGTVWRARDRDLDRDVAIKVLRREFEISPSAIERFIAEARIAGQLQHAGIPPIYEVGCFPDDRVYVVMKLIHGRTLSSLLRSQLLNDERRQEYLQYFESLCQTIAFAHSHGVIHFDLKPNNIMIGEFSEVHVMDWGLSRSKTQAGGPIENASTSSLLQSHPTPHDAAGTPGYMAPDLLVGASGEPDERADVFSLGVIFFELMTGTLPSPVRSFEAFDRVVDAEPLRRLVRDCLALDRSKRPVNAVELARVLTDYQHHLQTQMRERELAHRTERVRSEERRHRRRMGFAFASLAALAIVGAASFRLWQLNERRQHDRYLQAQVKRYLDDADGNLRNGQRQLADVSIRKAEGLATETPESVQRNVRDRLNDVRMLEVLESIRFRQARMPELPYPKEYSRISQAGLAFDRNAPFYYANAFREYGIDLEKLSEDEATAQIREKPIRDMLVRALDEWSHNAGHLQERDRLIRIADAAESPPQGMAYRIRRAIRNDSADELRTLASELRPNDAPEWHASIGRALRRGGLLELAHRVLSDARRRTPRDIWINLELGTVQALMTPEDPARFRPWIESAFALSDGNADVYTYLGIAQMGAGRSQDAEASFRTALDINPHLAGGGMRLAYALSAQKKHREALAVVDSALVDQPENPLASFNRGVILQVQQGPLPNILAAYRRAVTLDPQYAEAWNNLGNVLTATRQYQEAEAAFRRAEVARPGYTRASFNRAVLFDQQGRIDEAIEVYRQIIASDAEYAEAHYNLAHDLAYHKGRFAESRESLERGLRFVPASEPSRGKWLRLIDSCRSWMQSEQRLDELLISNTNPATAKEATELAVLAAWPHRKQFKTAVAFFERAFVLEPAMADDLVQGYRYFAAGCAARVNEKAMRDRALVWLEADLALREKQLASNDVAFTNDVKSKLRYWLTDPNFTAIRDSASLQSLDDIERQAWMTFWKRVRELQK